MSDVVIRAENLGKKFLIAQRKTAAAYATLGETAVAKAKSLLAGVFGGGRADVSPSLTEFWALQAVDFEIRRGEALAIIGRNGAGKSTLLKILSRIIEPSTGRVKLRGRVASLLEVGTGFHPELTGKENIFLNGAILGMSRAEIRRKFDEIVAFAEVSDFLDVPVKRYSSGMRMRLAFSVAAHLEPEILLIDEVLAVGDAIFQRKSIGKMEEVARQGRTILFVSHNMGAVTQFCESALLLERGRVAMTGKVRDVVNHYLMPESQVAAVTLSATDNAGPQSFSRIIGMVLKGQNGELRNVYSMGENLVAEIRVAFSRDVHKVEIGLRISTMLDQVVHFLTSSWEGAQFAVEPGVHEFRVEMPDVRLLPGQYIVGAWVSVDGEWSDANVAKVLGFEVISSDVTGHLSRNSILNNFDKYASGQGTVYVPSLWHHVRVAGEKNEY